MKKENKEATAEGSAQADDMEEDEALPNISFKLDPEEDTLELNNDNSRGDAEDAKDAEAKRQKRLKMSKLDKSRTAGGVFKGSGFAVCFN